MLAAVQEVRCSCLEAGRQMAAGIPGAKFVVLQSNNHILLEQDPAMQRFFEEIRLFLGN